MRAGGAAEPDRVAAGPGIAPWEDTLVPHGPSPAKCTHTTRPLERRASDLVAFSVTRPGRAITIVVSPRASVGEIDAMGVVTPPETSPIDAPASGSPVWPSAT